MLIRKYAARDLAEMIKIWNAVVEEGIAFPQEEALAHHLYADHTSKIRSP